MDSGITLWFTRLRFQSWGSWNCFRFLSARFSYAAAYCKATWSQHRDHGKENGNHYTLLGIHRDKGKGNGNYDLGFRV